MRPGEVRLLLARHFLDRAQIREQLDRKAVSHKARLWYVRIFDAQGETVLDAAATPPRSLATVVRIAPRLALPRRFAAGGRYRGSSAAVNGK